MKGRFWFVRRLLLGVGGSGLGDQDQRLLLAGQVPVNDLSLELGELSKVRQIKTVCDIWGHMWDGEVWQNKNSHTKKNTKRKTDQKNLHPKKKRTQKTHQKLPHTNKITPKKATPKKNHTKKPHQKKNKKNQKKNHTKKRNGSHNVMIYEQPRTAANSIQS